MTAAALLATAAHSQLFDATDPERLATVIRDLGYRAVLDVDAIGDPLIRSSAGGTEFSIYFYGCDEAEDCKFLLFKTGYEVDEPLAPERVNAWNESTLFGRAYVDADGTPWLEMPVTLVGGVSRENFEDAFDWWEVILGDFEEHIGF